MIVRTTVTTAAMGLMIAGAPMAGAMPVGRVAPQPEAQLVSLSAPSPRTLVIRRTVTVAVEPERGWGWAVPIVGSARILPSWFSRV